ncbi:MAG: hypothetical protein BroJett015_07810 [Chloroflexota bacterium]|nr:MAG: hypothetical protein BroJett015_07810 [Chloroflexota bacterium]
MPTGAAIGAMVGTVMGTVMDTVMDTVMGIRMVESSGLIGIMLIWLQQFA